MFQYHRLQRSERIFQLANDTGNTTSEVDILKDRIMVNRIVYHLKPLYHEGEFLDVAHCNLEQESNTSTGERRVYWVILHGGVTNLFEPLDQSDELFKHNWDYEVLAFAIFTFEAPLLADTFFFGYLHGSQKVCDYGQLVGVIEVDGSSFILGQLTQSKSPQVLSSSLIVDLSHDLVVSYGSQQSQPYRRMSPYASISS